MPLDGDSSSSPVRGTAQMFRCPVCDAVGRVGTTLGFGGTLCSLCQGRCYLNREPTPCPSCNRKGGHATMFGLRWTTCRLCHGVKYLLDKPFPCPKCRATGMVKGYGGLFSSPCNLCDRQRYLKQMHGRCIKCNFTSSFVRYFRPCINCGGVGYSPEPQHLCPRCSSTGSFKGNSCMLCGGCGVIHFDVVACAKCGGAGDIRRTFSLLLGRATCPTCNGQGYFQTFSTSSGQAQSRSARKRNRDSDGEGAEGNAVVPRDESDGDKVGSENRVTGGSEPRRVLKGKRTPMEGNERRRTISTLDLDRPAQPDFSLASKSTPAAGFTSANGWSTGNGRATAAKAVPDVEDGLMGSVDIRANASGTDKIHSPWKGDTEMSAGGGSSTGKRRRHR